MSTVKHQNTETTAAQGATVEKQAPPPLDSLVLTAPATLEILQITAASLYEASATGDAELVTAAVLAPPSPPKVGGEQDGSRSFAGSLEELSESVRYPAGTLPHDMLMFIGRIRSQAAEENAENDRDTELQNGAAIKSELKHNDILRVFAHVMFDLKLAPEGHHATSNLTEKNAQDAFAEATERVADLLNDQLAISVSASDYRLIT